MGEVPGQCDGIEFLPTRYVAPADIFASGFPEDRHLAGGATASTGGRCECCKRKPGCRLPGGCADGARCVTRCLARRIENGLPTDPGIIDALVTGEQHQ